MQFCLSANHGSLLCTKPLILRSNGLLYLFRDTLLDNPISAPAENKWIMSPVYRGFHDIVDK